MNVEVFSDARGTLEFYWELESTNILTNNFIRFLKGNKKIYSPLFSRDLTEVGKERSRKKNES